MKKIHQDSAFSVYNNYILVHLVTFYVAFHRFKLVYILSCASEL